MKLESQENALKPWRLTCGTENMPARLLYDCHHPITMIDSVISRTNGWMTQEIRPVGMYARMSEEFLKSKFNRFLAQQTATYDRVIDANIMLYRTEDTIERRKAAAKAALKMHKETE
jgi:hypothetical protein